MKKSLIIICSVALLGLAAVYEIPHTSGGGPLKRSAPLSAAAPTPASTTSQANATPAATSAAAPANTSGYKDGTFTGNDVSEPYGDVQIAVTISGGKITAVNAQLNGDSGHSQEINQMAGPELKSQTLQAQSASIDGVSGATYTSQAYAQSLQSALDQAKA